MQTLDIPGKMQTNEMQTKTTMDQLTAN